MKVIKDDDISGYIATANYASNKLFNVEQENAKLKRLLAEACNMLDKYSPARGSDELEQWYAEHKKESQNET